ncbi:unnamed protein product [Cladocopium goreaui]|uniref:non-specific serine/threonine protein kinase n=1 Tax=Cladocopium goreaui TaxID=2562237 RepID=A0A9P1CWB3_9DINO|nr:unnamed protein product [Cladocopium goreaui]
MASVKKPLKVPKAYLKKRPKVEDFYVLGASLGQGGFGEVFAAKRRLDEVDVAIKSLPKHGSSSPEREVAMMEQLDHPNIIKMLESFSDARKLPAAPQQLCDLTSQGSERP